MDDRPPDRNRLGLTDFLRDCRSEARKVTWPSRATLVTYSKVVPVTIVGVTVFVLALDLLFSRPPV